MVAPRQLQVVVGEAQRAVAQRDEQHRPDIAVAQIDPEQRGDRQREQDQHAAHRRRALLLDQMPFRAVAADRLAVALQRLQPADQRRAEDEADDQRGQAGGARAEGDVAQQVEQDELAGQRPGEVVQHQAASARQFECVDHQLHPAAEAALDQDGVAGARRRARRSARARRNPGVCATRIAAGTASNSSRISGPQANRQIGGGGDLGGERAMFVGACVAEFQHVAEHGDAAPRGLQAQHRERRAHRGGVAVVAFVEQQRGAARQRDLPARATADDRREAFQRTSQRSRPAPCVRCRAAASAASAFIAMWRPGAFRRKRDAFALRPRRRHRCRRRPSRDRPAAHRPPAPRRRSRRARRRRQRAAAAAAANRRAAPRRRRAPARAAIAAFSSAIASIEPR